MTIWYLVSARRTFTGPVRTIEFADDGSWRPLRPSPEPGGCRDGTLAVLEPATEAVLQEVPRAGVEEVDARRRRAPRRPSRAGGRWPPPTGPGCCGGWPSGSTSAREELAQLEARNAGKPIGDARGEMGMVADTIGYYAGAPERLLGDTIPVAAGRPSRCASRSAWSG